MTRASANSTRRLAAALVSLWAVAAMAEPAHADIANFDMAGQIYTKWLYRNDDSQGVVTYGNPFWPETFSGHNGAGSEFELKLMGKLSEFVEADVRLKSRFGSVWQDFYETGNVRYEQPNTSAESLGMDHAEYVKLRGYRVAIRPPYPLINTVVVGSTDLGMYNAWSVGKIRYTDRDNTKGVFIDGDVADGMFRWQVGAIALPKLWAGPGWTTGIGDTALDNPMWSKDWAFANRLDLDVGDVTLTAIASTTLDYEINQADPDATGALFPDCRDELGAPIAGCERDHAVDLDTRYSNTVATLGVTGEAFEDVHVDLLGAFSMSRINADLATNGVADNGGVFPMPFKDTEDFGGVANFQLFDLFGVDDLNLTAEYFYLGPDFVSHMAARRESDILATDGFIEGGQLPTLNIANEFQDFDEPFFESAIGWHGATLIVEQAFDFVEFKLEGTGITYTTNAQGRDVDSVYPDFLHTDGYTDTDLYDFANVFDRGRDPRSVYRENQDRLSGIGVLWTKVTVEALGDLEIGTKLKFIYDQDGRDATRSDDDYVGQIMTGRLWLTLPLLDELTGTLGTQVDNWVEDARSGSDSAGYRDYTTRKLKGYMSLSWTYGGANFGYLLEVIHKDQERQLIEDQLFDVVRSKAALSVAW